jgi:hypothetical protein
MRSTNPALTPSSKITYSTEETVNRIITLTEGLTQFWSSPQGLAPIESAELLTKSRLDWQASLARQLKLFLLPENMKEEGALILAWAALGSLTEGTMKLFLSVFNQHYLAEKDKHDLKAIRDRTGKFIEADSLTLENIKVFFAARIYRQWVRDHWKAIGEMDWIDWITKIQQRRNAIHAFKDRDIGTFDEFHGELGNYLNFMRKLTDAFPYPDDEIFKPRER